MARKRKPMVTVKGDKVAHGKKLPLTADRGLDRLMSVQRPVVLAHLRSIRRRHPDAVSAEVIRMLERRYLATVTTSGAAVGATAVIPAIGTATTLALSGVETAAFLEATALFAQSVSEVHGLPVNDPDRARALVMAMMLGKEGSDLVRQWGAEALEGDVTRRVYWGEVVTTSLPRAVVAPLTGKLKNAFLKKFAVTGSTSIIGKAIPFGIGAVIGGTGNHLLGRRVLQSSRVAFGDAPIAIAEAESQSFATSAGGDIFRIEQ
ncbi:MAG TPA: hypothetical protein VN133_07260 [Humibacter sp.]|nr:hypothetical protein [Humibacter sp.]